MMSALRPVFLTCLLGIATVAAQPAPLAANLPNTATIVVSDNITVDHDKVWARVGGTVTFVIENRDSVAHTVRIALSRAVPKRQREYGNHLATPGSPVLPRVERIPVPAGKSETVVFNVEREAHFRFTKRPFWRDDPHRGDANLERGMTYKYTVYTSPASGKRVKPLDPDIEIRP